MSGPHHALFSLSLADVYHADFGLATDFSKIEGLPVSTLCMRVCVSSLYAVDYRHEQIDKDGSPGLLLSNGTVEQKGAVLDWGACSFTASSLPSVQGLFIANQMRSKSGKPDDFDIADLLGFPLKWTHARVYDILVKVICDAVAYGNWLFDWDTKSAGAPATQIVAV
eukprot:1157652-Pelagomonas_calceolata.AAC.14